MVVFRAVMLLACATAAWGLAKTCDEWETKFGQGLWWPEKSRPCRVPGGAGTKYCCALYARLDTALSFFKAAPAAGGLGCPVTGDSEAYAKLYFRNCATFAATLPNGVLAPSPTPTPSVSPPAGTGIQALPPLITPEPPIDASDTFGNASTAGTPAVAGEPIQETTQEQPRGATPSAAANTTASNGSVCLHGALRSTTTRGSVRVDALQVGDRVAVGRGRWSALFLFTHAARKRAVFVNATTVGGRWVAVTPGHLVHALVRSQNADAGGAQLLPAAKLRVGDALLAADGSLDTIAHLSRFVDVGIYNPQTLHGDIVANDLIVSTYTEHVPAQAAHPALVPLRALWRSLRWSTRLFHCGMPSPTGASCTA